MITLTVENHAHIITQRQLEVITITKKFVTTDIRMRLIAIRITRNRT